MKTILTPVVGIAAAALVLAACSGGGTDAQQPVSDSAQPSTAPSGEPMPQGRMGAGGVSGEIVYAQDGTLQVQDSQSQTAVRYTADTTVDQRVTVALGDVTVGSCVVAIIGDDGVATTVTESQPVDGECTGGFDGGGRFPGGGHGVMPSGAPTALPNGGTFPSDAPTALPTDGSFPGGGQGGFGGTFVTGSVAEVTSTGLTVTTDDGSTDVTVGADTTITGTEAADQSAIAVGMCLTAQGTADDAGGFDATSITLSAKGDDGCSVRGFGGMRGDRGSQGGGSNG